MNWKGYLNFLKLSAKNTIKIVIIVSVLYSAKVSAQTESDSLNTTSKDTTVFVMKKSPWGAVLRSAVLPGLGQFYNESYWKIPVVWGFLGYFGYMWKDNNDSYIVYRDLFNKSVAEGNENLSYWRLRELYKDRRDQYAVYFGLVYVLNLIDAYVDAQLFDFSVSEDFMKNPIVSLRIKF